MEIVFNKTLEAKRLETSPTMETSIAPSNLEGQPGTSKAPLLKKLGVTAAAPAEANVATSTLSSRLSTRPTRSTRTSEPHHDEVSPERSKTVAKFSIDQGLGQPWDK